MGTRRRRLRGFGAESGVELGLTAGFSCEEARDLGSSIRRFEVVQADLGSDGQCWQSRSLPRPLSDLGGEIDHISPTKKGWPRWGGSPQINPGVLLVAAQRLTVFDGIRRVVCRDQRSVR